MSCSVVIAVSRALEELSKAGAARAMDYAAERGGWADLVGNDLSAANAVYSALLMLPAEQNLVLTLKVLKDNPRFGEPVLLDLACFVAHLLPGADRYGRAVLVYWCGWWATRKGSSREAARQFGRSFDTHQRFQREVSALLDRWFIAACGELEPVVRVHYSQYLDAA